MIKPLPLIGRLPYINNVRWLREEEKRWERVKTNFVSIRHDGFSEYEIEYASKSYSKNRKKYLRKRGSRDNDFYKLFIG